LKDEPIQVLISKARESIHAANVLLDAGHADFAASRAYYAMFYAAEALLLTRDERRSRHSGVIAAFGELFVKSGAIATEHYRWLREAFDERNLGDYALVRVEPSRAREIIEAAVRFVDEIERALGRT
jgi:uncharacterized protein (UPF0332 family)